MIPPGFASKAVSAAADFDEAVNRVAAVIGENPKRVRFQAEMHAATSLKSPIEALRDLALMLDADYLTEEDRWTN